jgi:hydroxymethylbilane synthase
MVQTESVAALLQAHVPELKISIKRIVTAGDRDHSRPLDQIGTAVFVKEIEDALLAGEIDLAVHSLKDVPTEIRGGLCLSAILERVDPRDALVAKSPVSSLPPGSVIGTDSLRRSVQFLQMYPAFTVRDIRGNVDTRLEKVSRGEYDGVLVATAALLRLGCQDKITRYLPLKECIPAVGQGALALESRHNDKEVTELVSPLNHEPTRIAVAAERGFLQALGGGCRAPIGALGTVKGETLTLEGMVGSVKNKKVLRMSMAGTVKAPAVLGEKLARAMMEQGAADFIAEVLNK